MQGRSTLTLHHLCFISYDPLKFLARTYLYQKRNDHFEPLCNVHTSQKRHGDSFWLNQDFIQAPFASNICIWFKYVQSLVLNLVKSRYIHSENQPLNALLHLSQYFSMTTSNFYDNPFFDYLLDRINSIPIHKQFIYILTIFFFLKQFYKINY